MLMKKIGLLSDTHSFLHPRIFEFFADCDEIWHAGDIGNIETADKLEAFKTLRAVHGNIDGHEVRIAHPETQVFTCEKVKICILHIGGYPGKYWPEARNLIHQEKPGIFISGHSHILKVIFDKKNNLLHLNPGAAGNSGLHKKITLLRFAIDGKDIKDMDILEIDRD